MKTKLIMATLITYFGMGQFLHAQDLDQARQLIEEERYTSAENLLEKNKEQANPEMNYLLVKAYLEQDKLSEAGEYLEKKDVTVNTSSADPVDRLAMARYLLNTGKKAEAESIFQSILSDKKNERNATLLLAMAEVAIEEENGNAQEALSWLELAGKRDRKNASIDIAKGLGYVKLHKASEAFTAYQEAIEKDPNSVRAHFLLGKIFSSQKNPEIYLEHFNKAYELDSTYAPVLEALYKHYYFRDVRIARKYLEQFVRHSDYSLQNDYDLTDIYYLTGDYNAAIKLATMILKKENQKAKPRLYKLVAYSLAKSGDSTKALSYMDQYISKEDPKEKIAADFEFLAQLNEQSGNQKQAITYFQIAADMDTVIEKKAAYASSLAKLYKSAEDYSNQAKWLGQYYSWKTKPNNVDLFNWGLASYMAKDYTGTDSIFSLYTTKYPEDIYGYYWRAQANAAIDTSMALGLAVPHYRKVAELGEQNVEANKKMLLKAYGYLGGYEANIPKNYLNSLRWFEKYSEIEENADIARYIETLKKWIAERK